jgi:protoporphyrinogen IX oxidase
MIEWYRPIMALHVIAIISWMAGILYLYRLLVYCAERRHDHAKVEELLKLMSRNLWKIITLPAMIVSWFAGITMVRLNPSLIHQPWFHVKFFSVILITISTFYAGYHVGRVQRGESLPRGKFFRVMNEVPTLLMMIVVFMVIVQPFS